MTVPARTPPDMGVAPGLAPVRGCRELFALREKRHDTLDDLDDPGVLQAEGFDE